jgi:hypothetical protein
MSPILTAFQRHYADLLSDYAEIWDCTLGESLKNLDKSLTIKRKSNGMHEAYDADSSLVCALEPALLAAYLDHKSKLAAIIKTDVEQLLKRTLAEVVDPYPYLTATQMLVSIDEFKQALEAEKVKYSAEIADGTRQFAPNIFVKMLNWKIELRCDVYLYDVNIPGRGSVPVIWFVKPDEQVKQVLKLNNFTGGGIEELRELLVVAARPSKLRALID